MNENELKFILRMRDEASAILAQHAEALGQAGNKAKNLKDGVNAASGSIMELAKHAREATEAVVALWTANEIAHKSLDAFKEYESGMQVVSRTTQIAGDKMVEFQAKFDAMAAATKGVSVDHLVEFSAVAGQLGIRGQADILKFSETIGKLTTVTDIAGEEGAKQFGRLLLLTGEGAKGTQKLADSLSGLQSDTKASAAEILMLASQLAQTTAGFKLGTDALTGFAAASAQLNIQPYLLSNAVGRTLRELKDGALNATQGMKDLSVMLGTSREDFLKLINTNPDQAFIRFLNVLKQIGASGQSLTGFLQEFQLQGDESQKVLLTLAQNVDEVNEKVRESKELQSKGGSLDDAYKGFSQTLKADLDGLTNSWNLFTKNLGKALSPTVKELLKDFTELLNGANAIFQAMPDLGQQVVAWGTVAVPALFGIHRVLKMFPALLDTIKGGLALVGAQFGVLSSEARAAATGIGAVEAELAAGGAASKGGGLAGKMMKGAGYAALYVGAYEVGKAIGDAMNTYTPETADAIARWRDGLWGKIAKPKPEEKKKATETLLGDDKNLHDRPALPKDSALPAVNVPFLMSEQNIKALEQFDKYTKTIQDLKDAESALQVLREGSKGRTPGEGSAKSTEDIDAIARSIDMAKRALDPMNKLRDNWHDQLAAAQAITKEQQNQAAIEKAINEERRNNPRFTDKDAAELRGSMQLTQSAERQKSYTEQLDGLQKQLAASRAITAADKERVEIDQQIADFVKQNGVLTVEQEQAMRRILALQKESAEYASLEATLNAQGHAIQNYERQVQLLQQAGIHGAALARAMEQLARSTEAARNPLGEIATQNEHELETLSRTGHYREAEIAALQQKYDLQSKGVQVDDKMLADLTEYQKRLQDLKEAQNSGFGGWANKVKDVQGQLQDLAGEFSNDLSSAIVGALEGKRNAFAEAGKQLGAAMIKMSVDGLMKQAYTALGLTDTSKQAAAAKEANDKIKFDGVTQMKDVMVQTLIVQNGIKGLTETGAGAPTTGQAVAGVPLPPAPAATNGPFGGLADARAALASTPAVSGSVSSYLAAHAGKGIDTSHFNPEFGAKLEAMMRAAESEGIKTHIGSGARSYETQNQLYQNMLARREGRPAPFPSQYSPAVAARPGSSYHEFGNAADVYADTKSGQARLDQLAAARGLTLGTTFGDQGHFQIAGPKNQGLYANGFHNGNPMATPAQSIANQTNDPMTQALMKAGQTAQQQFSAASTAAATNFKEGMTSANTAVSSDLKQKASEAIDKTPTGSIGEGNSVSSGGTGGGGTGMLSGLMSLGSHIPGSAPYMQGFSLLQMLLKGLGGAGGGLGGIFGSLFSAFHTGGVVGAGGSGMLRSVSPLIFAGAPRFHDGLMSDEFPAVLQRGERVLTAQQDQRATALMGHMADMMQRGGAQAAPQAQAAPGRPSPKITMNIHTPNASSFRYSQPQIMAQTSAQMSRASAKHN